jgi:hypothetical protein
MGMAGVGYRRLREATPLASTALAWRLDTSPVLSALVETARRVANAVGRAFSPFPLKRRWRR